MAHAAIHRTVNKTQIRKNPTRQFIVAPCALASPASIGKLPEPLRKGYAGRCGRTYIIAPHQCAPQRKAIAVAPPSICVYASSRRNRLQCVLRQRLGTVLHGVAKSRSARDFRRQDRSTMVMLRGQPVTSHGEVDKAQHHFFETKHYATSPDYEHTESPGRQRLCVQ